MAVPYGLMWLSRGPTWLFLMIAEISISKKNEACSGKGGDYYIDDKVTDEGAPAVDIPLGLVRGKDAGRHHTISSFRRSLRFAILFPAQPLRLLCLFEGGFRPVRLQHCPKC